MSHAKMSGNSCHILLITITLAVLTQSHAKPMSVSSSYEDLDGVNQISVRAPSESVDFLARRQAREAETASAPMQYVMFKAKPPVELTVQEGAKVMLECEVAGSPKPTISWMKNGSPYYQGSDRGVVEENALYGGLSLSRVKSRLFLDCLTTADNGAIFTCVASTSYKQIYANTKVQVVKKTSASSATNEPVQQIAAVVAAAAAAVGSNNKETELFANQNSIELAKDLYGLETAALAAGCLAKKTFGMPARIYFWTHTSLENMGADGVIDCRASGYPRPEITWYGPDDEMLRVGKDSDDTKYRLLSTGDLLIRNVTFQDMGKYRCVAHNQHGTDSIDKIFFYPTEPAKN